ncbi:hypothetical protein NDU88_008188 [Pleurodeles waltl]|uniref:Neuroblast differentiation-associated protein AHNAK n=1 Tax=Pleurodeles waltl TaxID=8319 RepID=A0AAV7RWX5_PLEWA|nr:hypothetical protein NDU88_008188 [Pleurodeles waltl]
MAANLGILQDGGKVILPGLPGSISSGITLENENGNVVVSDVRKDNTVLKNLGISKGDELVGATIYFENLSKNDVMDILKATEPYKTGLKLHVKNEVKSPESTFLSPTFNLHMDDLGSRDSVYESLFNNKIKRHLKASKSLENLLEPSNKRANRESAATFSDRIIARIESPRLDIQGSDIKKDVGVNIKSPEINALVQDKKGGQFKGPDWNVDLKKSNITAPGIKMPLEDIPQGTLSVRGEDLQFKGPELNGKLGIKDPKLNGNFKGPTIDMAAPDINSIGSEKNVKQPKFKMPSLGQSNIEIPSLDLSLPDVKGDFKAPSVKVDLPNVDVKGPKLQAPKVTADIPDVDLNLTAPEMKGEHTIPSPKLNANIEGPDLDINAPNISVKNPGKQINVPHFKTPSVGMSLPSAKASELDGNIKAPSQDVSLPKVAGELKFPATKADLPHVNIKGPDFKMPSLGGRFNTKADAPDLDLNLETPEFQREFDIPSANLKTNFEGPNVDINAPNIKLKNPEQNLKMPHFKMPSFGMSGSSVKAPELQGNIKTPSVDVSVPGVKGDFKSPAIKLEPSNVDVKGPTLKMPSVGGKFNAKGVVPDVDLNAKAPEIKGGLDITSPTFKTNIEGPDVDLHAPNIDLKGPKNTFTMPHFKMPSFGMSGPSVKAPEMDVNVKPPSLDVSLPKVEGDFKTPTAKMDLPNADVKGPKFKMPSVGGMFDAKGGVPDANLNVKTPEIKGDLDINTPKLKTNIKAPDVDINAPNINVKDPEKTFNAPHFKMPSFEMSVPSAKGPEIDGSIKTSSLDLSLPGVEGDFKPPSAKVDLPKADVKVPKFKMPSVGGIFNTKTGGKDLDLNVKTPEMKGDIDIPSPKLNTNIKGPDIDINAPNINLKGPENKLNMPHIKMPSFGRSGTSLKTPEVELDGKMKKTELDISVPKVKGKLQGPEVGVDLPDVDISAPKIKIPSVDVPSGNLSLPEGGLNLKAPGVKGDLTMKDPKLKGDIKAPNLDIHSPSATLKKPLFKMPNFKKSVPSIKTPELDLSLPKVEGDIKSPSAKIDVPKVEAKGPRFKMPSLKIFHTKPGIPDVDLGLKSPDLKGDLTVPTPKLQGDLKSASLDYRTPGVDLKASSKSMTIPSKVTGPDINLDLPTAEAKGRKLKMPTFGVSGPSSKSPDLEGNINAPSLDVSMPKIEGDFKAPTAKVDLPNLESKSAKFKMPSLGGMFNTNTGIPDVDLNVEAPGVKGDFNIPSPKLKTNIEGPDLDINGPNISLKGTEKKINLPHFKMPSFGMSGPSLKSSEIEADGKLNKPEVDGSVPKVKGKFKGPEVGMDLPGVDIKAPTMKIPSIDIPSGNISGPKGNLSVNAPEVKGDLNIKDPKLKGDIKVPNLDVKAPNVSMKAPDIKGHSPQFKMPSFGLSGPSIKGPQLDGTIDSPTLDVSMPKVEGDFKAPVANVDLPNVDVKGPKIKMPSFGGLFSSKAEVPDADINLKSPGLKGNFDINAPKAQAKVDGPAIDINAPNVNLKGSEKKVSLPEFKMPSFGISGPSVKAPELDGSFKVPSLDVSLPKVEGDLKAPSAKVDPPSLDVKGPKFKMPSLGGMFNTKADVPDANLNIKSPELKGNFDINAPKAQAKIDSPAIDINGPNVNLKGSEKNIGLPEFKMPSFGISGPSVKAPELDGSLKMPSLDVSLPKVEGDLKAPSAKVDPPNLDVKGPKFKMPSLGGMFNTKADVPDANLNIKSPELKGNFDINAPKAQAKIDSPAIDINGPNVNLKGSEKNISLPEFKMPSFGISGPSVKAPELDGSLKMPSLDVSLPKVGGDLKAPSAKVDPPNLDVKGPKFKMPSLGGMFNTKADVPDANLNIKSPELKGNFDINAPKAQAKIDSPAIDINGPNVNLKGSEKNISLPEFKMPSFGISGPSVKAPELDGSLKMPSLDVSLPKVEGDLKAPSAKVDPPNLDVKGPKFKMPSLGGMFNTKADVPDANLNIKSPELKGNFDINVPKAQAKIERPAIDINAPNVNVKGSEKNMSLPDFKMPSFGISGPSVKAPELDGSLKMPSLDVSLPKAEGDLKMPSAKVDPPSLDVKGPKFKMPSLGGMFNTKAGTPEVDLNVKGPDIKGDFDIPSPKLKTNIEGPDLDINVPDMSLKKPKVDVSVPKMKGNFQGPEVGVDLPDAYITAPKMKIPSVNMPSGNLSLPGGDLSVNAPDLKSDLNIKDPKFTGDIKVPNVDINVPNINVKGSDKKLSSPHFKMPSFGLSGPSSKGPKLDGNIEAPSLDVSLPKVDGKITKPDIGMQAPKVKGPEINMELPKAELKPSKFKMPKFFQKKTIPSVDVSLKSPELSSDVNAPKMQSKIEGPRLNWNATDIDPKISDKKINSPRFKMPEFPFSGPSLKSPNLDVGGTVNERGIDVTMPTTKGTFKGPNINVNLPSADITDAKLKMPSLNISSDKHETPGGNLRLKTPQIKGSSGTSEPKVEGSLKGPKLDIDAPDIELTKPEMKSTFSNFKMPTFKMSGPTVQAPDFDVSLPKVEGKFPSIDTKGPNIEMAVPDISQGKRGPEINLNVNAPGIRSDSKVSIPKLEANDEGPGVEIEAPNVILKRSQKNMNLPQYNVPSVQISGTNIETPKIKVGGRTLDSDMDITLPDVKNTIHVDQPEAITDHSGKGFLHVYDRRTIASVANSHKKWA